MPEELPAGYSWRPATLADAPAIVALIDTHSTSVIGNSDCTLDDINNQLAEPRTDLAADTWLVHRDRDLVAHGWVYARGTGDYVDFDVITVDESVRKWLYERTLARAAEIARAGGHSGYTVDIGIYRADEAAQKAAAAHGLRAATTFYRMRIDHDGVVDTPVAPEGVTLRSGPGDEEFRRTAHRVLNTSFKDHFGWVAEAFEDWHATLDGMVGFDWSQLTLAYLDGEPVGILLTGDAWIETDNCGDVKDLGVLAQARGRGIAKYLLRTAFAADAAAGRVGTILHVDSNNTTGALGLYEKVGMRSILVIDKWCATL